MSESGVKRSPSRPEKGQNTPKRSDQSKLVTGLQLSGSIGIIFVSNPNGTHAYTKDLTQAYLDDKEKDPDVLLISNFKNPETDEVVCSGKNKDVPSDALLVYSSDLEDLKKSCISVKDAFVKYTVPYGGRGKGNPIKAKVGQVVESSYVLEKHVSINDTVSIVKMLYPNGASDGLLENDEELAEVIADYFTSPFELVKDLLSRAYND